MISSLIRVGLLIIYLSLMNMNCYALQGSKIIESHHDTFDLRSLFSTNSCKPSSVQGPANRPASLKVTHKHGPCSKLNQCEPSLSDILTRDQIRVASIQNRNTFNSKTDKLSSSKTITLPAKSGITIGTGNYVVSVSLGTPAKNQTLIFDTGSSITWTQCQPCVGHCYKQNGPIFDPLASTSYHNISCNSAKCSEVLAATGNPATCLTSTCIYGMQYGDQSISAGFLATERLTLTPHDVFDNFLFGCGENNQGLFGNSTGLLGLGRDALSFVSQTAKKYGKYFSYCLPTYSGSNGHLTFGKSQAPKNLVFTPFATTSHRSSFYFVNITAISVGGRQLPISPSVFRSGGTIVDSGTVITRLAPTAYTALRDAFKKQMSKYPTSPAVNILDTCYDFRNYTIVTIPKISFIFRGNAKVDVGFTGIFIAPTLSQTCLAFAATNADTDMGVFGNVQQQTFEIAYDVAGGRLGFAPAGCS